MKLSELTDAQRRALRELVRKDPKIGYSKLQRYAVEELGLGGFTFDNARRLRPLLLLEVAQSGEQGDSPALGTPLTKRDDTIKERLVAFLRKHRAKVKLLDLARELDLSPRSLDALLQELSGEGYAIRQEDDLVWLQRQFEKPAAVDIPVGQFFGKRICFGAISDTHLCSYYERLDVLEALYDIFAREGITTVYHGGNIIDGRTRFNQFEVKWWALDDQIKYLLDNYPQREGITTYFITSDHHEGWWVEREGIDIGRKIQMEAERSGRHDLIHIGYLEADVRFKHGKGETWMKIIHPRDGAAYALSYKMQKKAESFQGGNKPRLLLSGHYHKFDACYPREIFALQLGCVQDQTRYMLQKNISAHVGGLIVELNQDENGIINRFKWEWIPFYDRRFYKGEGVFDHPGENTLAEQ